MTYKALIYGTRIIVVDRHFPSTQRCPVCGHIKTGDDKLVRGNSEYVCEKCGYCGDRDRTAALNLEQYPGLQGNWGPAIREAPTSMDDCASTQPTMPLVEQADRRSGNYP